MSVNVWNASFSIIYKSSYLMLNKEIVVCADKSTYSPSYLKSGKDIGATYGFGWKLKWINKYVKAVKLWIWILHEAPAWTHAQVGCVWNKLNLSKILWSVYNRVYFPTHCCAEILDKCWIPLLPQMEREKLCGWTLACSWVSLQSQNWSPCATVAVVVFISSCRPT